MSTPRKEKLVPCGAPLPNGGRCSRPAEPGYPCGFHPAVPEERQPLEPLVCECATPFVVGDGPFDPPNEPVRCLICGKAPRPAANRGPETPPDATGVPAACDPSPDPVPGQLQLDVGKPAATAARTKGGHMTKPGELMARAAALEQVCPRCGQGPGERCRNPRRDWRDRFTIYDYCNPHEERLELALRKEVARSWSGGDGASLDGKAGGAR